MNILKSVRIDPLNQFLLAISFLFFELPISWGTEIVLKCLLESKKKIFYLEMKSI